MEQAKDNIQALNVYKRMTPEVEEKIEKILNNKPKPAFNWKTFAPLPSRR